MSWLQKVKDGCIISVHLTAGSDQDKVQGLLGDAVKIRLRAPASTEQANASLYRFLSKKLGVAPKNIILLEGATTRSKKLLVIGCDPPILKKRLGV